jgi:hypothetical protein
MKILYATGINALRSCWCGSPYEVNQLSGNFNDNRCKKHSPMRTKYSGPGLTQQPAHATVLLE